MISTWPSWPVSGNQRAFGFGIFLANCMTLVSAALSMTTRLMTIPGDLTLHNLHLKKSAVEKYNLPVEVVEGEMLACLYACDNLN